MEENLCSSVPTKSVFTIGQGLCTSGTSLSSAFFAVAAFTTLHHHQILTVLVGVDAAV